MDKLELVRPMKMRKLAKHNSGGGGLLFSEDIMTEIYLWLPLKSLIRFKRLSKRWYFLISDKDSYFRRNYLSTLSTRRRNRIVDSNDDDSAIMAGFYVRSVGFLPPVGFLPSTSTKFKKYSFLSPEEAAATTTAARLLIARKKYIDSLTYFFSEPKGDESASTTPIQIINKINPFLSLKELLDNFLSARLHEDEEYYPSVVDRHIFVAASSNGFLCCTLDCRFSHTTNYLVNPVTMEWLALPQLEAVEANVFLGFVCKGDYPSLDLVEYTIVRLSLLEEGSSLLLFQLLSSSSSTGHNNNNNNNEWIEYRVSCESLQVEFDLRGARDTMIISTTTTATNNQLGGGGSRILVYFLVMVRITEAIAIVAIDLNVGDESLKMFETPGPDRGGTVYYCEDYIREFDDGVIHYVRFCCSTDFEFWVLNTESGEWYLKHTASLKTMSKKVSLMKNASRWIDAETCSRYHIHAFHPMNPSLIFLTLYGKFSCYNFETGMMEVVYDYDALDIKSNYNHFVYQWPCWPPLL